MFALVNNPGAAAPLALRSVTAPTPRSDEALVRVHAVSVNRGELALMAARPDGWRPGQDVAGVVERAAVDGSGPSAGTRIAGLVEGAGWAELVAVPTNRLAVLPDSLDFAAAASLPLAGLTALRTLRYGGDLLGRRALITGASGAVGRLQVELAARRGARVTAVAADRYRDELQAAGAEAVAMSVEAAVWPFDFLTESVGGQTLANAIAATAPGGTIVIFGASTGERTPISLYDFIGGHENVALHIFLSYASPQPFGPDLQILADMAGRNLLHPHVAMIHPWTEFADALKALQERRTGGKLVLAVG
jgi:NADPH:quinone reductase